MSLAWQTRSKWVVLLAVCVMGKIGGAAPLGWTAAAADRLKVEWVVVAPAGGEVKLLTRRPRAGVMRAPLTL